MIHMLTKNVKIIKKTEETVHSEKRTITIETCDIDVTFNMYLTDSMLLRSLKVTYNKHMNSIWYINVTPNTIKDIYKITSDIIDIEICNPIVTIIHSNIRSILNIIPIMLPMYQRIVTELVKKSDTVRILIHDDHSNITMYLNVTENKTITKTLYTEETRKLKIETIMSTIYDTCKTLETNTELTINKVRQIVTQYETLRKEVKHIVKQIEKQL